MLKLIIIGLLGIIVLLVLDIPNNSTNMFNNNAKRSLKENNFLYKYSDECLNIVKPHWIKGGRLSDYDILIINRLENCEIKKTIKESYDKR